MKKAKFLAVSLLAVVLLVGACGNKEKEAAKQATEESKKAEKVAKEETKDLKKDFEAIKIGDSAAGGEGGDSLETLIKTFENPDSTSETDIDGQAGSLASWSGIKGGAGNSVMSVTFINDKAVSKSVLGLYVAKGDEISSEVYNAVTEDGSYTYDKVIEEFGDPDGIELSLANGVTTKVLTWSTNVKGEDSPTAKITFVDDKVTAKTQFGIQ